MNMMNNNNPKGKSLKEKDCNPCPNNKGNKRRKQKEKMKRRSEIILRIIFHFPEVNSLPSISLLALE